MATDVHYNGIIIHNALTRGWDQEIVYDQSGTDQLFTRYKLKFQGIVHLQGDQTLDGTNTAWISEGYGPDSDIGQAINTVRTALQQPRGNLRVDLGGETVLEVSPADENNANRDVDNGPKPKNVSISHITGSSVLTVQFDVNAAKVECVAGRYGSGEVPDILNNRWSIQEVLDENFYMTRTIRGRMRLSAADVPADLYRDVVVPPLENGFKRVGLDYLINANGLEVDYVVTDRQFNVLPWFPATAIEGTHSESTADGIKFVSSIRCRITGHPGASKTELLAMAIRVIKSRVRSFDTINRTNTNPEIVDVLQHASFSDHFGERCMVEANIAIEHSIPKTNSEEAVVNSVSNMPLSRLGTPITDGFGGRNSKTASPPSPWGYNTQAGDQPRASGVVGLLLDCYLQDVCTDEDHSIGISQEAAGAAVPQTAAKSDTRVQGYQSSLTTLPPPPGDSQSTEHKQFLYNFARAETRYSITPMRAQLPKSQYAAGESEGSDTCVVVTLGLSQATRETTVDAERVGAWPSIPEPADTIYLSGNLTGKLLKYWVRPQPPTLSNDGTQPVYRIAAYYLYALNRVPTASESWEVGVLPTTNFTSTQTALTPSKIYQGVQTLLPTQPAG